MSHAFITRFSDEPKLVRKKKFYIFIILRCDIKMPFSFAPHDSISRSSSNDKFKKKENDFFPLFTHRIGGNKNQTIPEIDRRARSLCGCATLVINKCYFTSHNYRCVVFTRILLGRTISKSNNGRAQHSQIQLLPTADSNELMQ